MLVKKKLFFGNLKNLFYSIFAFAVLNNSNSNCFHFILTIFNDGVVYEDGHEKMFKLFLMHIFTSYKQLMTQKIINKNIQKRKGKKL